MLNLVLWLATLVGLAALLLFAWRSAMRRRGFQLLKLLEAEGVLRYAVDVPVVIGGRARGGRGGVLARRGTVVLTRRRLAGFAHRARFVLVRGGGARADAIQADDGWLVVRPGAGQRRGGGEAPVFRFRVPDAGGWSRDARKVLR